MSDAKPFLSLFCICGDAGAKTLGRMLKSVLHRADGALVDEIVIGWNGKDDQALHAAVHEAYPSGADWFKPSWSNVGAQIRSFDQAKPVLTILRQEWKNDFSIARNETMALCKGEWVLWLDSDDIASSAADTESLDGLKAIEAVENDLLPKEEKTGERAAGGGGSLREWLKQLAWNITCVRTPYDYMVNDQGKAVIRQFRRRLLRKECYLWHLPIHELAQPIPGLVESSVNTLGLLVRHYPEQESAERLMRNKGVLDAMQERKGSPQDTSKPIDYADARHAYDVASVNIGLGDLAAADAAIRNAISRGGAKIDTYRYRLTRAHINITRGMYETAYAEAVAATGLEPEMPDAWFVAGECMSLLGQWAACISFIKVGESKPAAFQPVDFVVARDTKPRTMIAAAYCELGKPELGVPYAEEAVRLHPTDAASLSALDRAKREADKNKAIAGALDAVSLLVSKREVETADVLLKAADTAVTLRGIHWLPRYQELRAATNAGLEHLRRDRELGDYPPPGMSLHPDEVYYDTKNGQPEDTESVVQYWRAAGHLVHRVAVTPDGVIVRRRPTKKRHITFYSPHAITQWDPYFPELYGIGGSEAAVVYLATELARRGYPITVYCPTGTYVGCDLGFVWRSLASFNMRDDHGLLIACRAPWVLRNPELRSPTFVWHQDNGYGSKWHWNQELDKRSVGSFHVSDWAKAGLIRELGGSDESRHHTIGNGVPAEWCMPNWKKSFVRNPHRVIYASDPTRGLDTLLNCWPHIVGAVPDAELYIYGAMMTTQALVNGTHNTQREIVFLQMKDKINTLKRLTYKGLIGQGKLTEEMLLAGVYAYAGGLMPEGYGIALAQAAAAGCAVVYPQEGALPGIHSQQWMVPPVKSEEGAKQFLDTVVRAMTEDTDRLAVSQRILEHHTWSAVADRLETVLKGV